MRHFLIFLNSIHFIVFFFFFLFFFLFVVVGALKLHEGSKYIITERLINSYTWQLNLTIKHLQKNDFGEYTCTSVNALGKQDARIRLQGNFPLSFYLLIFFSRWFASHEIEHSHQRATSNTAYQRATLHFTIYLHTCHLYGILWYCPMIGQFCHDIELVLWLLKDPMKTTWIVSVFCNKQNEITILEFL